MEVRAMARKPLGPSRPREQCSGGRPGVTGEAGATLLPGPPLATPNEVQGDLPAPRAHSADLGVNSSADGSAASAAPAPADSEADA
eukprot:4062692-Pyramimonas_sp.AAC.1